MLEFDNAGFEFAVTRGFRKLLELQSLFQRKFAHGSAADFGEMGAAAQLFSHFMREGADVSSGRTFNDKARDAAGDFNQPVLENLDLDRFEFNRLIFAR